MEKISINDIIQIVTKNVSDIIDFDILNKNRIFQIMCFSEKLEIIQKFLEENKGIDIHDDHDHAFTVACSKKRWDVVKWLLKFPVDIHTNYDYAFTCACGDGNFEIVNLLMNIGKIDIQTELDSPIFMACFNNHLDMAKWIYKKIIESGGKLKIDLVKDKETMMMTNNESIRWLKSMLQQKK